MSSSSSSLVICAFMSCVAMTIAQYYPGVGMTGGMGAASSVAGMTQGRGISTAMGTGMGTIGSGIGLTNTLGNGYGIVGMGPGYPTGYSGGYPAAYSIGYPAVYPTYTSSLGMGGLGGMGGTVGGVNSMGFPGSDSVNDNTNANTNVNINGASFRRSLHSPSNENPNLNENVNFNSNVVNSAKPQTVDNDGNGLPPSPQRPAFSHRTTMTHSSTEPSSDI